MIHVNQSGWKEVQNVYVKDGGVWKHPISMFIKDSGEWKKVWGRNPVIPQTPLHTFDSDIIGFFNKNGTFYVFLDNNGVYTSTDGSSWVIYGNRSVTGELKAIMYANGYFFATDFYYDIHYNFYRRIWRSSDGLNFTNVHTVSGNDITGLSYANGYYVAGTGLEYFYSTDGSSWSTEDNGGGHSPHIVNWDPAVGYFGINTHNSPFFTGTSISNLTEVGQTDTNGKISGVEYYNGYYIASVVNGWSDSAYYYHSFNYSTDGVNWTYTDNIGHATGLYKINGLLVSGNMWTNDGINWNVEGSDSLYWYVQKDSDIFANGKRTIYKY